MHKLLIYNLLGQLKPKNRGFTLIELLVVTIIIGILSAIAMPNLLGQIEKARQVEAKINLGSINRVQQSYRFEHATFTTIANLPVTITGQYYDFTDSGIPNDQQAIQIGTVKIQYNNDLRDYSAAVGQTSSGSYTGIVCEQDNVDGAITPILPTIIAGVPSCSGGTTVIK